MGVSYNVHSIDPVFSAFKTLLGKDEDRVTEGNLKARIRMCILYWYANSMSKLVVGTDDKSEHTLGFYCYDENTRVVTNRGPKGINELRKDDVVFSLNPKSRELTGDRGRGSVFKFDYKGNMVHFTSRNVDLFESR